MKVKEIYHNASGDVDIRGDANATMTSATFRKVT
jgi:hypothetical protein